MRVDAMRVDAMRVDSMRVDAMRSILSGSALRAALAGTALMFSACASPPPNLKAPEIAISDLTLGRVDFGTTRFELMIDARNPNVDDIVLTDVVLDLRVLGVDLGSGILPTHRILLAGDRLTRIPVRFEMPSTRLLALGTRLGIGALFSPSYRIDGSARWGETAYRFPLAREGWIDLRDGLGWLLRR